MDPLRHGKDADGREEEVVDRRRNAEEDHDVGEEPVKAEDEDGSDDGGFDSEDEVDHDEEEDGGDEMDGERDGGEKKVGEDDGSDGDYIYREENWTSLLHIYSVTVSGVAGDEPGIYGVIGIKDDYRDLHVFDWPDRTAYVRLRPGGEPTPLNLTDTNPPFVRMPDWASIKVMLMDKDHTYGEFEGYEGISRDPFSDGLFCFHIILHPDDFDKIKTLEFSGRFGTAVVKAAAFNYGHGVPVKIEVALLRGPADTVEISGTVKARPAGEPDGEMVLFDPGGGGGTDGEGAVEVRVGEKIPLSRSYMALMFNSPVHVEINLVDRRNGGCQFARGDFDFGPPPPKIKKGTKEPAVFRRTIGGDGDGDVEVTVAWIFDVEGLMVDN